ncbi:MAG TPA: hypothetical protein VNN79_18170 [Actinomycetota bacterium]|nr:hypothetical protein [Actinomycetota bacterium]
MLKRRRIPPELEAAHAAFEATLGRVERAKEDLVSAVPSARAPGRSLAEALADYEEGLREAKRTMPGWRRAETERDWAACDRGIDEAVGLAERFRLGTRELPFDALMFALQDLMVPLEAFEQAVRGWRRLRR